MNADPEKAPEFQFFLLLEGERGVAENVGSFKRIEIRVLSSGSAFMNRIVF